MRTFTSISRCETNCSLNPTSRTKIIESLSIIESNFPTHQMVSVLAGVAQLGIRSAPLPMLLHTSPVLLQCSATRGVPAAIAGSSDQIPPLTCLLLRSFLSTPSPIAPVRLTHLRCDSSLQMAIVTQSYNTNCCLNCWQIIWYSYCIMHKTCGDQFAKLHL